MTLVTQRHMWSARKRKGFGPKKIMYELISRGVIENIAYKAIENEGGWKDAALKVFNKKFKKGKVMDFKEQNKQKFFYKIEALVLKKLTQFLLAHVMIYRNVIRGFSKKI